MALALRSRLRAGVGGLPPAFWTLWTGMLVNRTASFVSTFLGLYLTAGRALSAAEAGRIVSLFGLGVFAAGPLGGILADACGRRFTMIVGLACGGAAVGTLAFVRSTPALAVVTFAGALLGEMYRPAAQAVVADFVPVEDRPRAYGLIYWAVNVGFTIGVVLAGALAERSWPALFLTDAATSLVFALLVLLRLPETRPQVGGEERGLAALGTLARDRDLLALLVLHFLALVVFTQFQLGLPLDMKSHGLSAQTFAWLASINGVGVVLLQPLIGARLRGQDPGRMLATAATLFALGFGLNAVATGPGLYAVGVVLWTVGEVLGFPMMSAVVAELSPPHLRGRYQGAFTMSLGLAFAVASAAGGAVLTHLGGTALWLGCLTLGLLVAAGHLAVAPARRRRLELMRKAQSEGVALAQSPSRRYS